MKDNNPLIEEAERFFDKYWEKYNQEHQEILLSGNFENTIYQAMAAFAEHCRQQEPDLPANLIKFRSWLRTHGTMSADGKSITYGCKEIENALKECI